MHRLMPQTTVLGSKDTLQIKALTKKGLRSLLNTDILREDLETPIGMLWRQMKRGTFIAFLLRDIFQTFLLVRLYTY